MQKSPERIAFRIDEAAAAIGVSRDMIYTLIKRGVLRTKPLGVNRGQLITAKSLNAFMS